MKPDTLTYILMPILLLALPLQAQETLSGTVTDAETRHPLEAVMVSVLRDSMTIDYALTDKQGRYTLPWKHTGTLQVCASYLGYARQTYNISAPGQLDFTLRTTSIVLREVEIHPGRISTRKDTVRYNLADFTSEKDDKIKDVLKRLPGIDVEENGTVTYKGKAVDHFLVEGMDVTGGRYNQINNNLDAHAVKTAEVMENYQPIRALKGRTDSEQVALNLRLDEKARDQWFPSLEAGTGISEKPDGHLSPLWEGNLNALRLGPDKQTVYAAKTNNMGRDLSNEQTLLTTNENDHTDLPALLSQSPFLTPLDTRRLLFNETYTTNANRMFRHSDSRTLRLQGGFTHDHVNQQRSRTQTYFQDTDTFSLNEEACYRVTTDKLHAALAYEDNNTTHYLTERLSMEGERNKGHASELGQRIETSSLRMANHIHYLHNRNEHTWELTSRVQYAYLPSALRLENESDNYRQQSLYTHHAARYLHKHNGFMKQLTADITAEWARYLLKQPCTYHRYNASRLEITVSPLLQWNRNKVLASIELPVNWSYYFGGHHSYILYQPHLYLRYRHDYHWTFSLYTGIERQTGNTLDLCPTPRRTDYRTWIRTNDIMPVRILTTGQAYAEYKNTIQEFFTTLTLNYTHTRHHSLYEQVISADSILFNRIPLHHTSKTWTGKLSLSKGFYDWHLKTSLDLQAGRSKGKQLTRTAADINAGPQSYRYDNLRAEPKIIWTPASWLETVYHATLSYSATRIGKDTRLHPLLDAIQRLQLNFSIGAFDFQTACEHYRNDLGNGKHHTTLLADASSVWRQDHWQIEVRMDNLFNKRTYAYTLYTATQSHTDRLNIRPREITLKISYQF